MIAMGYVRCVYCDAERELNQNSHRDRYRPVVLNEVGLCRKCEEDYPEGLPAGINFENDHNRYVNMLDRYFESTKKSLQAKARKRLIHVFKI